MEFRGLHQLLICIISYNIFILYTSCIYKVDFYAALLASHQSLPPMSLEITQPEFLTPCFVMFVFYVLT